jgi:thiamine pyrophosphokinase
MDSEKLKNDNPGKNKHDTSRTKSPAGKNKAGRAYKNKTGKDKINPKPDKLFNNNAILVTNGSIKDYGSIYRTLVKNFPYLSDTFVIAADGGALHCSNLRISPDVIIGDMDSITKGMIEKLGHAGAGEIEFISFNQAKDESDTQLALDYLVKNGYERIIIIGAFGGRADHSYANLSLLSSPVYDNVNVSIITENSEISVIKNSCRINGEIGKNISIFSLTPFTFFEKTLGLKYRLKNEKLLFSPARGISNKFTKNTAKISISEGWLLIIREL